MCGLLMICRIRCVWDCGDVAFESEWAPMLVLFALDVPLRETSIYLLAVSVPTSWMAWKRSGSQNVRVGLMAGAMGAYWLTWRIVIAHRFVNNPNDTGLTGRRTFMSCCFRIIGRRCSVWADI